MLLYRLFEVALFFAIVALVSHFVKKITKKELK